MAPLPALFLLSACGLPQAWQGSPVWRVLDTGFGDGSAFFTTWHAWASDPDRPRLLHFVAVTPAAPERDTLLRSLAAFPALARHSDNIARQWFGLLPGFHRLVLDQGRVLLTLCIGPLQAMLREQQFMADSVYLPALVASSPRALWNHWCVKALARLCRRGTAVAIRAACADLRAELTQAGFALQTCGPGGTPSGLVNAGTQGLHDLQAQYQPKWERGRSRHTRCTDAAPVSSCVVVGAGLAGATVAAALARRGWQVTVLDATAQPAAGASGLPVGLLAPQVSRDDSARSRLARAGIRLTLQLCHELLQHGQDWAQSGVLELRGAGAPGLPDDWSAQGRQWSDQRPVDRWQSVSDRGPGNANTAFWHAAAGWIKPARLVQACLDQPGVQFVGHSLVASFTRDGNRWVLRDAAGRVLARAPQVVIAAAIESVRLLDDAAQGSAPAATSVNRLAPMRAIGGQISWALQQGGDADAFPAFPVNGLGSFVPQVPMQGALAWFAGATYAPAPAALTDTVASHGDNLARLWQLLPVTASTLAARFANTQVQAWRGVRCTTVDRLPAVGPMECGPQPSVWVSTGMGSRGLTYAVLCAELLAARLGAEPLPVEASLWKTIRATRRALSGPRRITPADATAC